MALRDSITGLPSYELLQDRMELTMAQHQRVARKAVLLLLESQVPLDFEFRQVISQRMQYAVRTTDTVAMYNDYTFAVLITDLSDSDNAIRVADTLIQRCQQPYQKHGQTQRYRPSIGLSVYPDDASSVVEWTHKAELALDAAKSESNSIYRFYTEDMNVRAHRRKTLTLSLQKAWARDELKIYGQPIFHKMTGECSGVELLLRWEHPEQGIISAEQFADVAQACGLWASSCERLLDAAKTGVRAHPSIRWSWNAPYHIDGRYADDTIPFMSLNDFEAPELSIGLEIPERLLSEKSDIVFSWINNWVSSGGFVSIDNFGTTPVALKKYANLNIHEIKTALPFSPLLNSIAQAQQWRYIQKEIEHKKLWDALPNHAYGQGMWLHPPVPLEQLITAPILIQGDNI